MSFLPIVDRELRTRARAPITYRVRMAGALIALIIVAAILLPSASAGPGSQGKWAFLSLSILTLLFCFVEGLRNTADCLSEEKREGTMGLLFLTDLTGHDIVLGKIAAASLNSIYGLVAIFPVLALPVMMGGVTGAEFFRITLALICTIILSLSIGILTSARVWDEQKAWLNSFGILAGITFGLPIVDRLLLVTFGGSIGWLSLASPAYACYLADATGYVGNAGRFWISLSLLLVLSALMLRVAGQTVARHWQHAPSFAGTNPSIARPGAEAADSDGSQRAKDRSAARASRQALLDENPFSWLVSRRFNGRRWAYALVGIQLLYIVPGMAAGPGLTFSIALFGLIALMLHAAFEIVLIVAACRSLAEAKRSGALELLLTTPLQPGEILRGQWRGLRRIFLNPLLLVLVLRMVNLLVQYRQFLFVTSGTVSSDVRLHIVISAASSGILLFSDLLALVFVANWLVISLKNPRQAVVRTFIYVVFVPWLLLSMFPVYWIIARLVGGASMIWASSLVSPAIMLAIHIAFIVWARKRLLTRFRTAVSES
jgi:hypothetical protein